MARKSKQQLQEELSTDNVVEEPEAGVLPKRKNMRKTKNVEPSAPPAPTPEPKKEINIRYIQKKVLDEKMAFMKKKLYNPKLTQEKRKSIQAHINKMKNFVVIDE